jgi:predicted ATP-grasp superfamily ATP-dependent carboligase
LTVFNQPEFQEKLRGYGLEDMDWEGLPALNSYLLWVAERRNIPGVSLWPVIPFYLAGVDDLKAQKRVLEFFDKRFGLEIDFSDINEDVVKQNEKIAELRTRSPEIDKYVQKLESNLTLTDEESEKLARELGEFLRRKD